MIWSRIPKDTFVKLRQFGMVVYGAVAHFNQGNAATLQIYENVGVVPGYYTKIGCSEDNIYRLRNAFRQSTSKAKNRRKLLRGVKISEGRQKERTRREVVWFW